MGFRVSGRRGAVWVVLFAGGVALPALAEGTFPPMRAGLWESTMVMHMNMAGQPPDTDSTPRLSYNCQTADSMAKALRMMAGTMPGCVFDIEGGGGTYAVTTNCTNPAGMQGTITGKGTITTQGDSAMHMTETSVSTIQNMNMKMDMTDDSKWSGACPAGMAPGDFGTMANGAFQKEGNMLTDAPMAMPKPN